MWYYYHVTHFFMTTLEQDFAKAKSRMTNQIRFEGQRWAAWLLLAKEELGPARDVLWGKEPEQDRWNPVQKKLLFVLQNLDDVTWHELRDLIIAIGDVDDIWSVCFDHIAYMYGMCFVEEEVLDRVLEDIEKCEHCSNVPAAFAYQFVACGKPMTFREIWEIAHCSETAIWSLITMVENEVMCEQSTYYMTEEDIATVKVS